MKSMICARRTDVKQRKKAPSGLLCFFFLYAQDELNRPAIIGESVLPVRKLLLASDVLHGSGSQICTDVAWL